MHTGVAGAQLPQRKHEEEEDGWATRRADFFASSRAGASRRQWSLCGHHRCAAVCSLSHDSVPGAHGPCSRRILHVRVYSASGMQRPVRFRACDRVSVRILCAFWPGQLLVVVATGLGVVRIATLLVGSDGTRWRRSAASSSARPRHARCRCRAHRSTAVSARTSTVSASRTWRGCGGKHRRSRARVRSMSVW